MFSITSLLKTMAAVGVAVALCLIVNSADAAPKKTIRDGKLSDAEYLDSEIHVSSGKTKEGKVKIRHVPQLVVHPRSVSTSGKRGL